MLETSKTGGRKSIATLQTNQGEQDQINSSDYISKFTLSSIIKYQFSDKTSPLPSTEHCVFYLRTKDLDFHIKRLKTTKC